MELPGPPARRVEQEFQVVVAGVGGDVGVVGGDERHPEPSRVVDPARAEDKRVDRVDEVRTEALESAADTGVREGELYPRIGRKGHARDPVDRGPRVVAWTAVRVPGRYHEHLVARAGELLDGVTEAGHDAVGRRQEGLREERDTHRPVSRPP